MLSPEQCKHVIKDIQKKGWSVNKNFVPPDITNALYDTLNHYRHNGMLKQAGIGREKNFHIEQSIRSDLISWFDEADLDKSQQAFIGIMEQLKKELNQSLMLGLFELELHFALYAPNAFYKRHLDQHKNQDTRVLTIIAYLNDNWNDEDGGQLNIYLDNGQSIQVQPEAGTFVCFLSSEYEHEVLPAKRERASLTGWFRKRA